jgi:hypothetical protein
MTQVKFLQVQFSDTIAPWEIPAFRGAVVAKVGKEHHWFHNHLQDKQYLYRYPKIQYKCIKGRPVLFCIHEGVEEIHKLFDQPNWSIRIGERPLQMRIDQISFDDFTLQMLEQPQPYRIRKWLAINQKNYPAYQQMNALSDKIAFLEKKLASHMISFAKNVDWHIKERIQIRLTDLAAPQWVRFKNQGLMAFDASFTANVALPHLLGLGAKVSVGYGVVSPQSVATGGKTFRKKTSNPNETRQTITS